MDGKVTVTQDEKKLWASSIVLINNNVLATTDVQRAGERAQGCTPSALSLISGDPERRQLDAGVYRHKHIHCLF